MEKVSMTFTQEHRASTDGLSLRLYTEGDQDEFDENVARAMEEIGVAVRTPETPLEDPSEDTPSEDTPSEDDLPEDDLPEDDPEGAADEASSGEAEETKEEEEKRTKPEGPDQTKPDGPKRKKRLFKK